MSEPGTICTRCHQRMAESTTEVTIESGPLHDSHPTMALCSRCTKSLDAWFHRRHRKPSRHGSGSKQSHRGHQTPDPDREPEEDDWSPGRSGSLIIVTFILAIVTTAMIVYVVVR